MNNLTIQIGDLVLAEGDSFAAPNKGIIGFVYKIYNISNDEQIYKIYWRDEAFQEEEYPLNEVMQYRKDFIKTYKRIVKENVGKA